MSDETHMKSEEWRNKKCLLECPNKAGSIWQVTIDEEHWKSEEGEHRCPQVGLPSPQHTNLNCIGKVLHMIMNLYSVKFWKYLYHSNEVEVGKALDTPRARRWQNSKIPREAKQAHNYVPPTEQRAVINQLLWTILLIGSYISCGSSISSCSIPLCWMPSGFATRELVGGGW